MSERRGFLQGIVAKTLGPDAKVPEHADEVVASILVALLTVGSFWRLRYGVDFTDEAFYAAITQRYALGDVPYLDEYNLRQTASLLTVPPYWLYLKLRGSTDGVVYFLRIVYFAVQCGVGWTIFKFADKRLPRSFALLAASLPLVFIPFGIPTCSYNTLGSMLFAGGTFIGLRALFDDPRPRVGLAAGVAHGLACVAYPPVALPVLLFGLMMRFTGASHSADDAQESEESRTIQRAIFWRYAFGIVGVGLLLVLLLLPGLLHHGVREALNYEHMTTQVRSIDKAKEVFNATLRYMPGGEQSLPMLGVLGLIAKQYVKLRRWVIGFIVLYLAYQFQTTQPGYTTNVNSIYLSIYLGLLAGFFLLFVDWKQSGRTLMLVGWLPSVAAGFVFGFATANGGCLNGGMGLFAAACLAMIAAPAGASVGSWSPVARTVGVLVLAAIPFSTLSMNLETTYRSGPVATLTAKVRMGPYAGIHSTPDHVSKAEQLTRDVRELSPPGERMLVYYDFPAPYLATLTRPAVPTVWTDSRAKLYLLLPYYQQHRTGRGIVFALSGMGKFSPELESLVVAPGRLLRDGGWYRIYQEPPP